MHRIAHIAQFLHQGFIDVQTTRRIDDHGIEAIVARMIDRFLRDLHRIALSALEYLYADLTAHYLQLFDRRRTIYVARHQQGLFAALFDHVAELGAHRGFARALQARHHVDRRRLRGIGELCVRAAHQRGQFFVDHLDDLLRRGQAFHDFGADDALGHALDKVLHNGEVYIRLQQCHAHLAHCSLCIRLRNFSLAGKLLKSALQFFGQTLERHVELHLSIRNNSVSACRAVSSCASQPGCTFSAAMERIHISA